MSTQADIPSSLTDTDKASAFHGIDTELNAMILYALLHGMYTGILAVTLWNIFINKCWQIRQGLVVVIILLYSLTTMSFAANWSFMHSAFIKNGKSFWTVYLRFASQTRSTLVRGIASTMGTIITDLYMIWCCWMVWGQCWVVVLLPIISLIVASVSKIIKTYCDYRLTPEVLFSTLYTAFVLATTLWCTILIIYRILTVAGVTYRIGGRWRVYRHCIEVLVESSAFYSISLIVFLAFFIHQDFALVYFDIIAGIAKGVAPTLLIGRAAAGHTRPNDNNSENTVSSLHFQTASSEVSTASFQESTIESAVDEIDIEAQHEQSNELIEIVERMHYEDERNK